jgi:hypothetical protein
MFRSNDRHRQQEMFSTLASLPEKRRQRLESSWAGTFYREVFCRLDERPFAVLYSNEPSRPNIPVNVLVGLEVLKSGFGWSDEELYDGFQFNLQVRYALGCRDLSGDDFELRTLYNFRRRLSEHMRESGENLLERAFEQVTDEQIAALNVHTGMQRVDSTMIASNIRQLSRLQLLVEVLQRVYRMLSAVDQEREAEAFAPYLQGTSGQYCYRLKREEIPAHLERIGPLMQRLVTELAADYGDETTYQVLCRVFAEHFALETGGEPTQNSGRQPTVRVKAKEQLSAQNLQSPDDLEATFRQKGRKTYQGYVLNVMETCDPTNPLQLVTKVQVAPNCADDGELLRKALPNVKERTELAELWSDGNYSGPPTEEALRQHEVKQVLTGIRGQPPDPARMGLAEFSWEVDEARIPHHVTCPGGQRVEVQPGRSADNYRVYFDAVKCAACPRAEMCRAEPLRSQPVRRLRRLVGRDIELARLRQLVAQVKGLGYNPRAAIEATIRSCKHPFGGKTPVRGQVRVSMFCVASAMMVNARRIWRYWMAQERGQRQSNSKGAFLLLRLAKTVGQWLWRLWPHQAASWAAQLA